MLGAAIQLPRDFVAALVFAGVCSVSCDNARRIAGDGRAECDDTTADHFDRFLHRVLVQIL